MRLNFIGTFLRSRKTLALFAIAVLFWLFPHKFADLYFYTLSFFNPHYQKERALIDPFFDENFYKAQYAEDLQKTQSKPLDHFLQRAGRLGGKYFKPNPWFETQLYKERLWPCLNNPFADFLGQASTKALAEAEKVEIYAQDHELFRAWMACEAFLRQGLFRPILVLPEKFKNNIPPMFKPMIPRGLQMTFSPKNNSFYKSPFLKNPTYYNATELEENTNERTELPIVRMKLFGNFEFLEHHFYGYASWKQKGKINPLMINVGVYAYEPIVFSPFSAEVEEFKTQIKSLAPGFDLLLINEELGIPQAKILPGYLFSYVDPKEVSQDKEYSVSMLLSLGGKGLSNFKNNRNLIYKFRKEVWDKEKDIPLKTNFYISRRDIHKFPQSLAKRVLPTNSKAIIYSSQFSIAIENVRQRHYFSEKLLDCFLTKTIPIYIGCPNIGDYFDTRGMFIAQNPQEIMDILKSITPDIYKKMKTYAEINLKKAQDIVKLKENIISEFYKLNIQ
jgi:hypothetical protein